MKRYIPYVLAVLGVIVIIIGGIGAPAGPPGMEPMPREGGALMIGVGLIVLGAGWLGYDFYHARRRKP